MNLVLASGSPRRKEILEGAGLKFKVAVSDYEEDLGLDLPPHELAKTLSQGKARDVASREKDAVIIAADTFIVLEGKILGKPHTGDEARRMLRELSGKAHSVITGFTVLESDSGKTHSQAVETKVWFKTLTDGEIDEYVRSGEPIDKAGAYAIQGRGEAFVERIEGDYLNVVGLPLAALMQALKEFV